MNATSKIGAAMRRTLYILLGITSFVYLPYCANAAGRASLGVLAGLGTPVGWWADRWGMFQSGEVNFRYEIGGGTGFFLMTGLNKTYYAERSREEIEADSRYNDVPEEHRAYMTVTAAEQGGSFKQLPVGFGFYQERDIADFIGYGSLGMVVNLWKFERGQTFEATVNPPSADPYDQIDNWSDVQDGSNIGFQFAGGVLYPLRRSLMLDASIAYYLVGISSDNSAIAYWGKPARTWSSERRSDATNRADYITLRFGVRFGK